MASSAATSALRQLLNKSDSNLGPWRVGKAPLEDSLQSFNGAPGGPMYHPWEGGLPFSLGYSGKLWFTYPKAATSHSSGAKSMRKVTWHRETREADKGQ